jgi:beta-glucosidase
MGNPVEVSINVTNTGRMKGDEIIQLYIHKLVSLPTRPVQELKDFARITLEPGATQTVRFMLTPDKLAAIGMDMKRTDSPGTYEIMVGRNSADFARDTITVR